MFSSQNTQQAGNSFKPKFLLEEFFLSGTCDFNFDIKEKRSPKI